MNSEPKQWEEYLVPTSLEEALAMLKERQGQGGTIHLNECLVTSG